MRPRLRSSVVSLLLAALLGCAGRVNAPVAADGPSPEDHILAFVDARCNACGTRLSALEATSELWTAVQDTDAARSEWRDARREYSMMRFLPAQYLASEDQRVNAWFTATPCTGFNYFETLVFAPSPDLNSLELDVEESSVIIHDKMPYGFSVAGITVDGVFRGLHHMLADIDTFTLTGYDSLYADNGRDDIIANLAGLDSAYACYRPLILASSPSADSILLHSIANARTALLQSSSMRSLDKSAFRRDALQPLQDALSRVAHVLGVVL